MRKSRQILLVVEATWSTLWWGFILYVLSLIASHWLRIDTGQTYLVVLILYGIMLLHLRRLERGEGYE